MKIKCYYDKYNNLINIGEWESEHPLPKDAIEREEEVTINEDGSRTVVK
jgi:hypothetical protein